MLYGFSEHFRLNKNEVDEGEGLQQVSAQTMLLDLFCDAEGIQERFWVHLWMKNVKISIFSNFLIIQAPLHSFVFLCTLYFRFWGSFVFLCIPLPPL